MTQSQPAPFFGPLYEQVHKILRTRILSGEWKPQEILPGEVSLSQELGVSVGTIRKAMDQLARENLVVRERGRGTFVKDGGEWKSASGFRLAMPDGQPILAEIELENAELADASPAEILALKIRSYLDSMPRIYRITRKWLSGRSLLCRETTTVEASRFPDLLRSIRAADETFHPVYAETFRAKIDRIVWEMRGPGQSFAAQCDDVPLCGPVLVLNRTVFDGRASAMEFTQFEVCLGNCAVQLGY